MRARWQRNYYGRAGNPTQVLLNKLFMTRCSHKGKLEILCLRVYK